MEVTIFNSLYDKNPIYIDAARCVEQFRKQGKHQETLFAIRESQNKGERAELKKVLPVVCFGGKFSERKKSGLIEASGLLNLDFDEGDNLEELRSRMNEWESTYATFSSPSGGGRFKALIRIDKVTSDEEYKRIFAFFEENYPVDKSGKDISRCAFITHDEETYLNTDAEPFTLDMIRKYEKRGHTTRIIKTVTDVVSSAPKGQGHYAVLKASYLAGGLIASGQVDESLLISELKRAAAARRPNEIKDSYQAIEDTVPIGKQRPLYNMMEIEDAVSNLKPKVDPSSFIVKREKIEKESEQYYSGASKSYKTGIEEFDHYFSYRPNTFYTATGGKAAGKTTLKIYLCTYFAVYHGLKYLIVSFENDAFEIEQEVIGFLCQNNPEWVRQNNGMMYEKAKELFYDHFTVLNFPPDYRFLDITEAVGQINSQSEYHELILDPLFKIAGTDDYSENKLIARHAEPFANEVMSLWVNMHPTGGAQRAGTHVSDLSAEFGGLYSNAADITLAISRFYQDPDPSVRSTVNMSIDKVRSKKLRGGMETIKDSPIKFEYLWKQHNYDLWIPTPETGEGYTRYQGGLLKNVRNKLL